MAIKPILFSGPMVRALLEGRKTQTRRVIKDAGHPSRAIFLRLARDGSPLAIFRDALGIDEYGASLPATEGDLLWVRESWRTEGSHDDIAPSKIEADGVQWLYEADQKWNDRDAMTAAAGRLRPGIHMPRWASRLTLEITDVKVERLQEISKEDVLAEGMTERDGVPLSGVVCGWHEPFAQLWNSINGAGAWESNPWIVALTFNVHKGNIDTMAAKEAA